MCGVYVYVSMFVGHRLATKLFIGKLPATRGVRVIIGYGPMMRGVIGLQNSCSAFEWGAFNHASHDAPQLRHYNYYVCMCIFVFECVCLCMRVTARSVTLLLL